MSRVIQPGATLGVLGSGQLGRMFTIAARRLGYRVHVLSPDSDTPTGQVADVEVRADYEDLDAIAHFARSVDVVTFEFENVPAATTNVAERFAPVRPAGHVLHTTQNRLREKTFLRDNGFPAPRFHSVTNRDDLAAAVAELGTPAVLKTADWGYDGKGQCALKSLADLDAATAQMHGRPAILEQWVDFECELSVVAARGADGQCVLYGPIRNDHHHHILDVSTFPAEVAPPIAQDAVELARAIVTQLEVVGVLCVEMFLERSGRLLVNELAPRPHNSGHFTIDACVTCQFAQQVRSVCGLPLGSSDLHRPAAMVNLLGDLWEAGPLDWTKPLALPGVKLHLYGKSEARPGRKMGHMTALAETPSEARAKVLAARALLTSG